MGWFFSPESKDELIRRLTQSSETAEACTQVMAFRLGEDTLWSLVQVTAKRDGAVEGLEAGASMRYIRCDLLQCVNGQWGYKPMDESVHPYRFDCPLAFLEMAPVRCQAWRDAVRKYANA